jgi:hypothetical protein
MPVIIFQAAHMVFITHKKNILFTNRNILKGSDTSSLFSIVITKYLKLGNFYGRSLFWLTVSKAEKSKSIVPHLLSFW